MRPPFDGREPTGANSAPDFGRLVFPEQDPLHLPLGPRPLEHIVDRFVLAACRERLDRVFRKSELRPFPYDGHGLPVDGHVAFCQLLYDPPRLSLQPYYPAPQPRKVLLALSSVVSQIEHLEAHVRVEELQRLGGREPPRDRLDDVARTERVSLVDRGRLQRHLAGPSVDEERDLARLFYLGLRLPLFPDEDSDPVERD